MMIPFDDDNDDDFDYYYENDDYDNDGVGQWMDLLDNPLHSSPPPSLMVCYKDLDEMLQRFWLRRRRRTSLGATLESSLTATKNTTWP